MYSPLLKFPGSSMGPLLLFRRQWNKSSWNVNACSDVLPQSRKQNSETRTPPEPNPTSQTLCLPSELSATLSGKRFIHPAIQKAVTKQFCPHYTTRWLFTVIQGEVSKRDLFSWSWRRSKFLIQIILTMTVQVHQHGLRIRFVPWSLLNYFFLANIYLLDKTASKYFIVIVLPVTILPDGWISKILSG